MDSLRYIIFFLLTIITFIGCGGTHSSNSDYKLFLYNLLKTEYFWASYVSDDVNYSKYNSPQEMIDDLKYKPKDRWSIALTKEQNDNFLNQKSEGFGFAYTFIDNRYIVTYVRLDSPADIAGIKRGDIIEGINNQVPTIDRMHTASTNIGEESIFHIYRASLDTFLDISILSQEYQFKVTKTSIVSTSQHQMVEYMRFDLFTIEATEEIDRAFDFFKEQNITKLVIDMRYNGGGSIITASILLDKLMRNRDDEVQFSLSWNSNYQQKNETAYFETDNNSLDLDQIIFLTTEQTASASELVINALRPYKGDNIIIVGGKTHGKPVGMEGKTDGVYVYYLINFVIKNMDGFYDYFDGLDVTSGCESLDDLTHQLGDTQEEMLKKALYYIDNGHC